MSWSIDPKKFAQQAAEDHRDWIKSTAIGIVRGVIKDTPIRSGRLRSNWFVTEGSPSKEVTEEERRDSAGEGIWFIDGYSATFPVFYLTNNLEYAAYVNNGTPTQEAQQFVEKNVNRVLGNL